MKISNDMQKNINTIADYYGNGQTIIMAEEMAELTQALCKYNRLQGYGQACRKSYEEVMKSIVEEMADVALLWEQLLFLFDCEEEIKDIMKEKIERTYKQINLQKEVDKRCKSE